MRLSVPAQANSATIPGFEPGGTIYIRIMAFGTGWYDDSDWSGVVGVTYRVLTQNQSPFDAFWYDVDWNKLEDDLLLRV